MTGPSRILVPTDFSDFSDAAFGQAVQLAQRFDATLYLVHVAQRDVGGESATTDKLRRIRERLQTLLNPTAELNLKTEKHVLYGSPHRSITEYAREQVMSLIVMGTHGRTGVAHLALGSVAERVLRSAPCPVMVVPKRTIALDAGVSSSADSASPVTMKTVYDSPALDLVQRATILRSTDIHIDPTEGDRYSIRFRIDGRLHTYCDMDRDVGDHLVNQFKTLADLDIADPFLPKEGRLHLPPEMSDLQVRVTTIPVAGGEAVSLRLLWGSNIFFPLTGLGLSEQSLATVQAMLRLGEGLVLITGPTGAGKTTTVYCMLETLNSEEQNIVSIEDPVEFATPLVRQMNVDEHHGITMTSGLKTILRMDPDIVFVGEVRDAQAADTAMRAASSGKYVFSTLHTRDVASTVTALRDLHIDDRSMSGNLNGIVNQRLMRRLCTECRRPVEATDQQRQHFEQHKVSIPATLYERVGCDACRETGYRGRVGVFEVALITADIARAIAGGETEADVEAHLRSAGIASLQTDALKKVAAGITDLPEAQALHWMM